MKSLITAILLLTLLTTAKSQSLKSFFGKYSEDERFEYVSLGRGMISMANIFVSKNEDFTDLFSKIDGLKILSYTDGFDDSLQKEIKKELSQILSKTGFETLMEMREKEELLNIYAQAKKENNVDILIISKDTETISIIWLTGDLKPEDLIKLLGE